MSYLLPEPIVDSLLDKLGHDEAFRASFHADPRAALAALGFAPAADPAISGGIWACMEVDALASMETIRASHALLKAQFARKGIYSPFHVGVRHEARAA